MIAFLDRKGQTWAARLDVAAALRMRDFAGLDVIAAAIDPETNEALAAATPEASETIAAGLYWLCQPQAERLGVTPQAFYKRLRALDANDLRQLLFEGITAFFRMPGPKLKRKGKGKDDELELTAPELWRDLYRLAGEAGAGDPGPLTFGELAVMAEGRRRAESVRFALLRADVLNSAPFRKGPAVDAADLDGTGALKESTGREKGAITPGNLVGVFSGLIKAMRN